MGVIRESERSELSESDCSELSDSQSSTIQASLHRDSITQNIVGGDWHIPFNLFFKYIEQFLFYHASVSVIKMLFQFDPDVGQDFGKVGLNIKSCPQVWLIVQTS